ncbi:tetratricopeptide repeat protein [Streptomyces sp. N2A]|uniref:tetratricopeptide repeat protein n=1 Tax=Streptomyces sp. N2A TaxID=3073936 RepID=UPI0028709885|nr:tetratricopeptide repeat protein [Streptomyces sp. N2A]
MHRDGNAIGGSARIEGSSVQAGEIHGGIHIHARDPAGRPARLPVPRQLLPVSPHFTDREGDLAALNGLRTRRPDESTPLIVVSGPAGIGKTALVSRWLRGLAEQFPDGQLYADLRGHSADGPAAPSEVLGQFLRALGIGPVPAGLGEQTALWRSVTAGLRVSVMLDNAFSAAQVRPLLTDGRTGLIVATSRHRLTGLRADGALYHQLGLLDPAAAEEMLSRGVGADRVRSEARDAHRLIALCGGLPLALCLASARLASRPRQPMRSLVESLTEGRRRLAALTIEGESSVHHALDASYAVLADDAARLYRRLALLPARTVEARLAASACAVPLEEAEQLLDALVEANLVEDIGPDSYRFHDLVRLHAAERGRAEEPPEARSEALRRVCDWYLATATEAQRYLSPIQLTLRRTYVHPPELPCPFTDSSGALGWLDGHRLDLLAAVHAAYEEGWDELAWQLVDALWPLFHRLRHHELWLEAHAVGLQAARRSKDRVAERQMLNSGAIGFSVAGRVDDAIRWFSWSLDAAREAGDARDEGQALHGIGSAHRQAGRFPEASTFLHQAIETWEAVGYPRGAALSRIVLGEMALESPGATWNGRPAAEYFDRARTTLLAVDDPYDAARALAFHGRARAVAGAYEDGVSELAAALLVFEEAGATPWQARVLEMLGRSAAEHTDPRTARDCFVRARDLYARQSPSDAQRMTDLLAAAPAEPADPEGTAPG